jgi:hypothetical protein
VTTAEQWTAANKRHLLAAVDLVRCALERHAGREANEAPARAALAAADAELDVPAALTRLETAFVLSAFERDVLLLCAGVELDAAFEALCREVGASPPTFSVALAALPDAHWSALTPTAPLRHWLLVEPGDGPVRTTRPLRIDERVLHFLTGTGYLDERVGDVVCYLPPHGELPPSHAAAADRIAQLWDGRGEVPLICLSGGAGAGASKRAVAAGGCAAAGLALHALRAADAPATREERTRFTRLWEREAILGGSALLIEVSDEDPPEAAHAALALAERLAAPVLVSARDPLRTDARATAQVEVARPTRAEQRALWAATLGPLTPELDGDLGPLVAQFDLAANEIELAARSADPGALGPSLWDACRRHARPRLHDLAERIVAPVGWDDLVLPDAQLAALREIALQVRHRARVYEAWGFGARGARGLGISALFHGTSGTGKTLAAEVLARELELDLYRIDLSQVVSKYIGETEKNLRRVFDAAEGGGAVLLFDEADALFGQRTEVKDSHDRYANIEISYLLQRMEAYQGLAILTTNRKSALDQAFLRRLRFVVAFPFPDEAQRARIWARTFPPATPTAGLDLTALARLNVAGGNIRNVALGAAFLAAEADGPVTMAHLLQAARTECAKIERPVGAAEIGGWT